MDECTKSIWLGKLSRNSSGIALLLYAIAQALNGL